MQQPRGQTALTLDKKLAAALAYVAAAVTGAAAAVNKGVGLATAALELVFAAVVTHPQLGLTALRAGII